VLALCLGIALVFVLLSRWQLESSRDAQTVYDPGKEIVRPLDETLDPGTVSTLEQVDTAVEATGTYLPDSTVLIENRLQDGRTGWWVVAGLQIPGTQQQWADGDADADIVLPVVRGWSDDPEQIPQLPQGEISVVGRLLPQEAPVSTQDQEPGRYASLSPAQLSNVWDVPIYSGFVTAVAEAPAAQPAPQDGSTGLADDDATLPEQGSLMSSDLEAVSVDQQPTDTSLDPLNIFYAVEWVVFAGFALWIWYSSVRDDHRRRQDPAAWFELDGESLAYAWDQEAQRFYYYDPVAGEYFYFDDQPAADHSAPAGSDDHTQDRGSADPQSGEQR
jgi:cytochrome oxidase assembly protein ShyY1